MPRLPESTAKPCRTGSIGTFLESALLTAPSSARRLAIEFETKTVTQVERITSPGKIPKHIPKSVRLTRRKDKATEQKTVNVLTKKPIRPSLEEVIMNPRCRSARMRVAECH